MASAQKGAEAQQQTILFLDEAGFYPLPSVVRTYAPVGQTPILQEWWTRDHLSALSAISPAGKLYFHSQDHPINSDDVVAFLEHLLREVSGRIVLIWDLYQHRYCWRSHIDRFQRAYAASAANADRRVLARGIPSSHDVTRTTLIAVAVMTCCTWIFACPM